MDGQATSAGLTQQLRATLDAARASYLAEGEVTHDVRRDRLSRALTLLYAYEDRFIQAISDDFSHRSPDATLFTDVMASASALKEAHKHVGKWMRREKRSLMFPVGLLGGRAWLEPQPKGVVGLITPWNFPLTMVFVPLAQMLAAGNRVMIKPSEHTPKTSALMAEAFAEYFDPTEVSITLGGVEVSQAFSAQPFDHLMFTGAPVVGKLIMRAASEHLVPVTLELGGKSPVIVSKSADVEQAAERIATMKLLNAGQICLAPDYVNVHASVKDAFLEAFMAKVAAMYPTMKDNPDYTAIISDRHHGRISDYLRDAEAKGGTVTVLSPDGETLGDGGVRKLAPALIDGATDEMAVMQEEIFGPLLPIRTYEALSDVVDYINAHERPLALYYFGSDPREEHMVLTHTTSGGVTINDCLFHGGYETLPFGGIGNSGMGAYHGYDGFKEFSHMKPVLRHPKTNIAKLMGLVPPYGPLLKKTVARQLGRKSK